MSTLFFRDARLTLLFIVVVAVAGVSALWVLPRREDPELTPRNALLITRYPGADADCVERLVTDKLEDLLDEFEEVKETISTSRAGISTIQIELHDRITETEGIWSEMRDDLATHREVLPAEAGDPVLEDLEIDAATRIVALAWEGEDDPERTILQRYAEELADLLRAVPGTKRTQIFGANPEEVRVTVAAERLAALGLEPEDIARTLRAADSKVSAGRLLGANTEWDLEVAGAHERLAALRELPVRSGLGDRTLRLGDVATLEKGVADPPLGLAYADGRPAVVVAALIQSDQRIDEWGVGADAALDAFQERLPGGFIMETLFDQRRYTEARLEQLVENLGFAALLVALVVLLMLGWRAAVVVSVALPLACLMVLAAMRWMEIPIHQMSVTGLIIALGLLIDNAIVMTDEVRTRMEEGATPLDAVGKAVRHLAVPLLGSTVTTILAFMPIALMPGPAGEFVGTIAVSVGLAIASSFFLGLTIVPALTARLGRPRSGHGGLLGGGFRPAWLTTLWARSLRTGLRYPFALVALVLLPPFMGFAGFGALEEQFFPPAARDQFQIELRLDPQSAIGATEALSAAAREELLTFPEVQAVHWFLGSSAPKVYYNQLESEKDVPWYASAIVQLHAPLEEFSLLRRVQRHLDAALPSGQFLVRALEQGPPVPAPIEIHIEGPDLEVLETLGEEVRATLATIPGVTHTRATLAPGVPKLELHAEDLVLERVGWDRRGLARALEGRLTGAPGGSFVEGPEELPVRVRLPNEERGASDEVLDHPLIVRGGDAAHWVPLRALATGEVRPTPGDIEHKDGQRSNTVQGFVEAGRLPATVLTPLVARLEHLDLPPEYHLEIGGESEQRDRAVKALMVSVGLLVTLMMATLVLSFRSFRMAGLIGMVGALSIGLSLLALRAWGLPFGFNAIIGTIGLVGVAVNDSIVVLAAIREHPLARAGDRDALVQVVLGSSRHVLATTFTTAVGFTPLFLEGGGFWPPIAVAIGGGVLGATLLALIFVPGIYALTHRRRMA